MQLQVRANVSSIKYASYLVPQFGHFLSETFHHTYSAHAIVSEFGQIHRIAPSPDWRVQSESPPASVSQRALSQDNDLGEQLLCLTWLFNDFFFM